jgi:hypothetical protein
MSTFNTGRASLGLKDASARLEHDSQTQSKRSRFDLRRRYDQAIAVAFRAKSIWAGIDEATATLKAYKESKRPKVVVGLFWVSALA